MRVLLTARESYLSWRGIRKTAVWAMAAIAVVLVGCAVEVVEPSMGLTTTPAQTRAGIIKALPRRGWVLKSEKPGEIIAENLVRGRHSATVAIRFDDKNLTIAYVGSDNLDYDVKDGQRVIHGSYNKWVTTLRTEIMAELAAMSPPPAP